MTFCSVTTVLIGKALSGNESIILTSFYFVFTVLLGKALGCVRSIALSSLGFARLVGGSVVEDVFFDNHSRYGLRLGVFRCSEFHVLRELVHGDYDVLVVVVASATHCCDIRLNFFVDASVKLYSWDVGWGC